MKEAIEEHDMKAAERYKKQQQELQTKLQQGYQDQEKMKVKLEDMQRQHLEQLQEMQRSFEESKAELEAARAKLDQQREQLKTAEPGSYQALSLQRNIAEGEHHIDEAAKELGEQEQIVQKKKKSKCFLYEPWSL